MKWIYILICIFFIGCSKSNHESRELPTKYPHTPTSGAAYDISEELYKK